MARQRISFLESNVEKIVLGVSVVVLLGLLAWQFGGGGNTVAVGGNKEVPISNAYPMLETQAKKVKAFMDEPNPKLPEAPAATLMQQFEAATSAPVAPAGSLAWTPEPTRLAIEIKSDQIREGSKAALVPLPAPGKPVAVGFMSTIDPVEVQGALAAHPEAAPWFNAKEAPFDQAAVSVEATFNGADLRKALESDPDGEGTAFAPLPKTWYEPTTHVMMVELVRERRMPDGSWSESTVIGGLPGRFSFAEALKQTGLDQQALAALANEAGAREEDVLRPEFYRRAELMGRPAGDAWLPPTESSAAGAAESDDAMGKLQRRLREIDRRIAAMERQREELRRMPAPGGGSPGRGPASLPGRGPGGGGPAPAPGGEHPQIKQIEAPLTKLRAERDLLAQQIEQKGGKAAGGAGVPKPPPAGPRDVSPLLTNSSVRVWAHDISAKRGETYRYQMRLLISNPVFGRPNNLSENEAGLASRYVVPTSASEWSDPVAIDPDGMYFITAASERGGIARGSTATAEVFVYSWGHWRKGSVSLEPGDGLTAVISVPDAAKIAAMNPAEPGAPMPAPGPGGPGRTPGAPEGPGGPGGPGGGPPGAKAPAPEKVPMTTRTHSVPVFLLEVAPVATVSQGAGGAAKVSYMAYVREADGSIVPVNPESERAREAYKRLSRDAAEGVEQVNPKAPPPAPKAPPPVAPPPVAPPRPGGGGGGGGGGAG
ncbi:MAG: hypothetical protein KIT68_06520 [Phycisphaeraceae bacterium]|nr:hypothetical protein [Phycisphaeraceae bacterium]